MRSEPPGAPERDVLPFPAVETTLANQLRVIVIPTGFPNIVSLQIPVQTGSRNEVEPGKSGFAHFFEHMMFRGTKRYPPERYQAIVTRTGARQNAYTTDDYTNYHATFAKEDLETFLEIEADRFMHLEYSEEAFRIEAKAILGEYNKSASEPLMKLFEVLRDTAFDVHPYKHTTMGFLRDIEDMPNQFEYSRLFFERWYRPEYTTIIVAGDVEPAAALAAVERHWGSWQPGGFRLEIPQEPPPRGPRSAHVPWPAPTLPWLAIAFRGPAFSTEDPDYAAIDTLLDLAFGETSDLYRELVEELQVVDQLIPWFSPTVDPSLATVLARVRRPEDVPLVRERILATLADVRERPLPSDRVDAAKAHARYAVSRLLDNSESIASLVARFAHFERSYHTVNRLFRVYAALTPDELLAAARRYLLPEAFVQTTLSHDELPDGVTGAPQLPARAEAPLRAPTVVQRSATPLVRFKLVFQSGSADDPEGGEGLARLTASVLAEGGSRTRTIDEIRRALFPLGGSLTAQVDKELTVFTIAAHRDTIDRTLDLVLPQLLEPGFREEDITRLRTQQRNRLTQDLRLANDEELGKELLQARAFAGTPYAHPVLGTVAGLEALGPAEVQAAWERLYARERLLLGAAGALDDRTISRLERELGARLPSGSPPEPRSVRGRMPRGLEVAIVEKETPATAISLGNPIPVLRGHPDWPALWLARSWLGEHRAQQGRLFQRMRELRGLNYGDYAYIEAFPGGMYKFFPDANVARRAQLFEIWIRPVLPANAVFALKLALFEVRRMLRDGIPEDAFEETREYLRKNAYLMTKTQDHQLGYAIDSLWYGIPDFVEYVHRGLAELTAEGVNRTIRQYISGSDFHVVFVTKDARALRDRLLDPSPARPTYDVAMPPEIAEEDERVAVEPLDLDASRIEVLPVDAVFAR